MTPTALAPPFDRLSERRIVMLADEVTDQSASTLVAQLLSMSMQDPHSDICLLISSPGGSVLAGLGVYDVVQLIPNDVATVAVGFAASMGQILLCGGTPGKRFALPNAQVVMHEGSAGLAGIAADVEIQAAHLQATLHRMRSIISAHTGRSLAEVTADVGRDRWFDAHEALEYGFVDHVVSALSDIVPAAVQQRVGYGEAVAS